MKDSCQMAEQSLISMQHTSSIDRILWMKKMQASHDIICTEILDECVREGHATMTVLPSRIDYHMSSLLGRKVSVHTYREHEKRCTCEAHWLRTDCLYREAPASLHWGVSRKKSKSLTKAFRRKELDTTVLKEWMYVNRQKRVVYLNLNYTDYPLKFYLQNVA